MAFWKKIFKSKYTGAEIDAAVAKADIIPSPTIADKQKGFIVGDDGKLHYAFIGNCELDGETLKVIYIDENNDLVTLANSYEITSVTDLSTFSQNQYRCNTNTTKCLLSVSQLTSGGLLTNNTASFDITKYTTDVGTDLPLDLDVGDYFNIADEIYLNMSTDVCVLRCVDNSENSVSFAGSFLTAANPLLANKLVYVSVLIQSDGTKWTVTMNIIKYALST